MPRDFIAQHGSPQAAARWYEALRAAVESLAFAPRRCGYACEHVAGRTDELRQFIVGSHRLIFTIRGDEVHVLHIRHAARSNIEDVSPD